MATRIWSNLVPYNAGGKKRVARLQQTEGSNFSKHLPELTLCRVHRCCRRAPPCSLKDGADSDGSEEVPEGYSG